MCGVSMLSVFAHPGSLDSNGGHWDRKSGTYHFHKGTNTGGSSSSNSNTYAYEPFTPPYEPPTDNPYKKDNSSSKSDSASNDFVEIIGYVVITMLILIFGVPIVVYLCLFIYEVFLEHHTPKYKIMCLTDKIFEYQNQHREVLSICVKLLFLSTEVKIPDAYEIGADGLPRDKNRNSKWGESFTMYKTPNGKKLHKKYNCSSATTPVHIEWYRSYRDFSDYPCHKCARAYTLPDLSWYEEYRECQKLEESQKYKESKCQDLRKEIETLHQKCNSTTTKMLIVFSKKSRSALREANALYDKMQSELTKGV